MYPQIYHYTDKMYLDMITDLKFVYNIYNPLVEKCFGDQITKIDRDCNFCTRNQNQKAAEILFYKLDVHNKINFMPLFIRKAVDCNVGEVIRVLKISTYT